MGLKVLLSAIGIRKRQFGVAPNVKRPKFEPVFYVVARCMPLARARVHILAAPAFAGDGHPVAPVRHACGRARTLVPAAHTCRPVGGGKRRWVRLRRSTRKPPAGRTRYCLFNTRVAYSFLYISFRTRVHTHTHTHTHNTQHTTHTHTHTHIHAQSTHTHTHTHRTHTHTHTHTHIHTTC
jgi:hypothetical protein